MIPCIEDIIKGLLDGTISAGQAEAWINAHIEMARESQVGELRDIFAGQALQGLIAHYGCDGEKEGARIAYKFADAMLKARGE